MQTNNDERCSECGQVGIHKLNCPKVKDVLSNGLIIDESIDKKEFSNSKNQPVSQSFKKNKSAYIKAIVIIIIVGIFGSIGFSIYNKIEEKKVIRNLLTPACAYELRLAAIAQEKKMPGFIGDFTKLTFWYLITIALEKTYYSSNNAYTELNTLNKYYQDNINTYKDEFANNVLEELETSEYTKQTKKQDIELLIDQFFTIDSSLWNTELRLTETKDAFILIVSEIKDVNYDGDQDDYFIFDSNKPEETVKFIDNGNSMNLKNFEQGLRGSLMMKMFDSLSKSLNLNK